MHSSTTEVRRLAAELARAYDGDAWHGPSLAATLADVDAVRAAAHPIPGAHSIWELVLHLAGWAREVAARLDGNTPGLPAGGDWPEPPLPTPEAWEHARAELAAAHAAVARALERFAARRGEAGLDEPVGATRETPAGAGVSYYVMLHGLAQHDAYHGGQITMLKRAGAAH
jgi:uncharacterized damage-inducible protein DinB